MSCQVYKSFLKPGEIVLDRKSTRCCWHLCSSWPRWQRWQTAFLLLSVPMGLSPCAPVAMATLRTSPPFLLVTSRRFSIKPFFIFPLTPHFQGKPKCECPGGGGLPQNTSNQDPRGRATLEGGLAFLYQTTDLANPYDHAHRLKSNPLSNLTESL